MSHNAVGEADPLDILDLRAHLEAENGIKGLDILQIKDLQRPRPTIWGLTERHRPTNA